MMLTRRSVVAGIGGAFIAGKAVPGATLIVNAYAITMDDRLGDLPRCNVRIVDGEIAEVGPNLTRGKEEVIDAAGAILLPGFVDTHWHMWNEIARSWARSARGDFAATMKALAPLWTPEDAALGVRLALAEAVISGITTVSNWAHNTRSPGQARAEYRAHVDAGIRGRFNYGYPQDLAPDRSMDLNDLQRMVAIPRDRLVDLGVCLRGPDRSAEAVWRREWMAARSLNLPITTHTSYDARSAAKHPIRQLAEAGWLGSDTLMVHATAADDDDLQLLAQAGAPLSISPWTELEVGYGVTPVARMAAAKVLLALSNDNVVLAGKIDMFAVMKLALDLATGEAGEQGIVTERDVLRWATIGGAHALGMADTIGSITPGKAADLILVRTSGEGPVERQLTHEAGPADVEMVMVAGRLHKRHSRLVHQDVARLRVDGAARMRELAKQAQL